MSKFYSKSTGGFYTGDVHEKHQIPIDAVEISDETWRELLDAQARGQQIVAGTHGGPVAVDRDPAPGLLASRDAALRETDWLVARHRDEVELDPNQTTLTDHQYSALQQWRRSLRNITSHPDFPRVQLPERPL